MDEMGGCLIFYRQFVERADYEIFVITDKPDFKSSGFPWCTYRLPRWIERLKKTRISKYIHDFVHLTAGMHVPRHIYENSVRFQPDLVLIGAETPIADLGITLSKKLRVPLAGHFMDWPTFAMSGHKWITQFAVHRFRSRYAACDLTFGICPEILEKLGKHRNAHVFYPSRERPKNIPPERKHQKASVFHILFAGNLGQWYGRMVLDLAKILDAQPDIQLVVAGKCANWTPEEENWMVAKGMYVGFLKGEEYDRLLDDADCLLICMGFEKSARQIESTSFKSKIVDYMVSGRPILVWGPEYCTAVRHARKFQFAECVVDRDPGQVLQVLRAMRDDPQKRFKLVKNALEFFEANLNSEKVFNKALEEKMRIIHNNKPFNEN